MRVLTVGLTRDQKVGKKYLPGAEETQETVEGTAKIAKGCDLLTKNLILSAFKSIH